VNSRSCQAVRSTPNSLKTRYRHWADARSVRVAAWLLRRTNGRIMLLLTTCGRRSGLLRTVPLQYFPDDHGMVVVAANGGMPNHPGWYLNLMAPRMRMWRSTTACASPAGNGLSAAAGR
jgi:hypothetical protein